ncbi:hypothetical protein niasHS_014760 [Heterodera schachtii]|uniref:Uncharacterized protein n=2 Tax=Heterodera TaxID=34509 RepID=A0ABD2J046_HETSC
MPSSVGPSSSSDLLIRLFLLLDSAVHFALGAFLFFCPSTCAHFLLKRPSSDGVHWHLLRCVGGQLMASATLSWRCASPRRLPELRSSCLMLRLLGSVLFVFLFLHIRAVHPDLMPFLVLRQLIWFCFSMIALCVALLIVSGWPIGDKLFAANRWGNVLYQIDTIASISIGMAWVMAPQWLLHRQVRVPMDQSHEFCGHLMGVVFIASHVISSHALHWPTQSDRAMAAETRAVLCVFILSAQIWSQIAYGQHWSDKHWVGISLFSSWTLISIIYRTYLWASGLDQPKSEKDVSCANDGSGTKANGTYQQKKMA